MKYFAWHKLSDGDLDQIAYRIEVDQRILAVTAGLKVAAILLLLFWR